MSESPIKDIIEKLQGRIFTKREADTLIEIIRQRTTDWMGDKL